MICTEQFERDTAARPARTERVRARLALDFEYSIQGGKTILAATQQQPPLRVVRAFPLEDGAALVHLHNVSGGLLGGDALELEIRVGAGAQAQITTTGATRIYRPKPDALPATQTTAISVGDNAVLEYVPDSLIPFTGARFAQRTAIQLASGSGLFWWEIVAPGREASGEKFAYESIEWVTDLRVNGRLVAAERARVEPRRFSPAHPARMGAHRYVATFFICREGLDVSFWLAAEQKLRAVAASFDLDGNNGSDAVWGVSTLVAHGLVVRGLAPHGFGMMAGLRALWSAAKEMLYGRQPIWPRKVN
jgi:urease accessory protein